MVAFDNFLFFDNATAPDTSKVKFNQKGSILVLEVSGDAENILLDVEARVDFESEEWTAIAGINMSDFTTTKDGITKKGIYQISIDGISYIRLNLKNVSGSVRAFGRIMADII